MDITECNGANIYEWNMYEWKNMLFVGYKQKDWNQTLCTKINQISAYILMTSCGGANKIEVNTKHKKLIESLEYYKPKTKTLHKYDVIFNDDIQEDFIFVYRDKESVDKFVAEYNGDNTEEYRKSFYGAIKIIK